MAFDGQGTTLTFVTSGYEFNVIDVGEFGQESEPIETTHLGTTGGRTYIPADLTEGGDLTITVEYDPDIVVTVPGSAETIQVDPGGQSKLVEFSGFVTSYKVGQINTGERVTATLVIKITGDITWYGEGS